ncbi:MAG: DNA polymerase III subunit beta [Patescibacteria group bacterium]
MKFICTQEHLNKSLQVVSQIKASGMTLPILENILIKAEKGMIVLSSTDLEIGISSVVRSKVEKEGEFTVPAHLFSSFIGFLPNKQVEIELVENSLKIKCEKNETKIKGQEASEFPVIPQINREQKYTCSAKDFKGALKGVASAISSSEIRIEIGGALLCFNCPQESKLTLVGTDSYRLAEREINFENYGNKDEKKVIVPLKTVQSLMNILEGEADVEIYVTENQILFVYQENEIISRLVVGDYPNYKQIIPKETKTEVVCSASDLIKAVKGAGLFSRSGINDINLKFVASENKIIVSSVNDQVGENVSEVEGDISGEDNEITFNHRYFLDCLQGVTGNEVYLSVVDSGTPALIRPVEGSGQLYVVMPISD